MIPIVLSGISCWFYHLGEFVAPGPVKQVPRTVQLSGKRGAVPLLVGVSTVGDSKSGKKLPLVGGFEVELLGEVSQDRFFQPGILIASKAIPKTILFCETVEKMFCNY